MVEGFESEKSVKHTSDFASSSESKTDESWDSEIKGMLSYLESQNIAMFESKSGISYISELFWPKRSVRVSFINIILKFLKNSGFKYNKPSLELENTSLVPVGFNLNDLFNLYKIRKIHVVATENFVLSNPFGFYNFVNNQMLNPHYGEVE